MGAALAMAACGGSPVYSRHGLFEPDAGGNSAATPDGGFTATGGRVLSGSGGGGGGGAAAGGTIGLGTGGAMGGTPPSGGATGDPSGGAGGVAATGGAATGGAGTGGGGTGGAGTGGAGTGGDAMGGAAGGGAAGGGATGGSGMGGRGTGGASQLPAPCWGLCMNPVVIGLGAGYSSGSLGKGASCFEVKEPIAGGNCSNFVKPRTLHVNGVVEPCDTGENWSSLPAMRHGGYCIKVTPGDQPWANLTLW